MQSGVVESITIGTWTDCAKSRTMAESPLLVPSRVRVHRSTAWAPSFPAARSDPERPRVVVRKEQVPEPPRAVRVAPFPDEERGDLLADLRGLVEAGKRRLLHHVPRGGGDPLERLAEFPDVLRRGAAAPSDDRDPLLPDEGGKLRRERLGGKRVVGLPVPHLRDSGVGDAGDAAAIVAAKVPEVGYHFGPVAQSADREDGERLDGGQGGGDGRSPPARSGAARS